jgi:citrate synthase
MLTTFLRHQVFSQQRRFSAGLLKAVTDEIPMERERIITLRKEHGGTKIGEITVNQVIGGMRGMPGMIFETSMLNANTGIRLRGKTVEECKEELPKFSDKHKQPLPEAMLWLLLTGDVPTNEQVDDLRLDLFQRAKLDKAVLEAIYAMPKYLHPMAQLSAAVLTLQKDSFTAVDYSKMSKFDLWIPYYKDSIELIAALPIICATIYNRRERRLTFQENYQALSEERSADNDWTGNFCNSIGFKDEKFHELMRLYFTIHSDHEGGNVSAHASHLVGSALSDPYYCYAASMCGLAGPLHGLANQECLGFITQIQKALKGDITEDTVRKFCEDKLKSGQVIPGFGHAVLRKTDPRYTIQREFALENLPDDETFKLTGLLLDIVPKLLEATGKVQNPWPNVDAVSGCLLQHYKFNNQQFYTMLFGMGRSLGVLSSLTWSRVFGLPIERPKSFTIDGLTELAAEKTAAMAELAAAKKS